MLLGMQVKWEVVGDTLYFVGPILRAEDVLIKEISPGLYQVRPLIAGAHVTTQDGIRFYVFLWSGITWITE